MAVIKFSVEVLEKERLHVHRGIPKLNIHILSMQPRWYQYYATKSGNDSGRQTAVLYALANIRRDSVELDTAEQDILRVSCFCDALSDVTLDVTTPSPNIEIMSLNMQPAGTGRAPSSSATFLNLPAGYGHQIEIHLRFKTSEDGNTCFKTLTTESTTGKPDSGMGFEESDCNIPSISVLLRVTASIGKGILQEHHTQLSILADSDKGYRAVVDTQETIVRLGIRWVIFILPA